MVSPLYLAAVAAFLTGLGLLIYGHTVGGGAWGTIIGPLVIGIAVGIGMIGGGVRNPYALTVLPLLVGIGLVLVDHFNIFGINTWGL